MRTGSGECIWEWKCKLDGFDVAILVHEYNIHVCYKPPIQYYTVTVLDYVETKREQRKVETLTEAFHIADKYYEKQRDVILSTVRGLEEADLWNQMEAEDYAEAVASSH